jgi:hypothetical protein
MPISLLLLAAALLLSGASPKTKPDFEKERAALLEIHRMDRRAHFETNVDLLLNHSAETFVSVNAGKIDRSSRAQMKEMFNAYFNNAKYYEWDDLETPIISISNDASIAWMIVRTRVRRTQKSDSGEVRDTSFVYAGIMTYEKRQGKWLRIANVSTFEEGRKS